MAQQRPHEIAQSLLQGAPEPNIAENNPLIREYLANGGINMDPATQAWCAQFVNASLAQAGLKGTGSAAARSFLNYGEPVLSPRQGDIAVFKRRADDPDPAAKSKGHAGFYMGETVPGYLDILGGNQSDAANVAMLNSERLLGFRRPPGAPPEPPTPDPFTANLSRPFTQVPGNFVAPALPSAASTGGGTLTPRLAQGIGENQAAKRNELAVARLLAQVRGGGV